MKSKVFYLLSIFLFFSTSVRAEQDFYGIQMRNERWAGSLVLGDGPAPDPRDLAEGPVLSHAVHAEASLKPVGADRLDFRVNVINDSSSEISSDYEYRDFFIYTKDGRKFPLIDENEDSRLNTIEPRGSRIFAPSLGNLRIQNEDVRMVSCSFDLGRTQLFLFPWSKKEEVSRLTNPVAPPEPVKKSSGGFLSRLTSRSKSPQTREPSESPAPPPAARTSEEPAPSSAQPATTQERLDKAIKNFVYKPSIGNASASAPSSAPAERAAAPAAAAPAPDKVSALTGTKTEAHVIGYDKQYNFVTLSIGFKDGLRQNMPVTILRDGKTVAKAKIKQLRDRVAAAILLPGTVRGEVRAGDKISLV